MPRYQVTVICIIQISGECNCRDNHLYFEGKCHQNLMRGPCEAGQQLVFEESEPKCVETGCEDKNKIKYDGLCLEEPPQCPPPQFPDMDEIAFNSIFEELDCSAPNIESSSDESGLKSPSNSGGKKCKRNQMKLPNGKCVSKSKNSNKRGTSTTNLRASRRKG